MVSYKYIIGREVNVDIGYEFEYWCGHWGKLSSATLYDTYAEAEKIRKQIRHLDFNGREVVVVRIHPDNLGMFEED